LKGRLKLNKIYGTVNDAVLRTCLTKQNGLRTRQMRDKKTKTFGHCLIVCVISVLFWLYLFELYVMRQYICLSRLLH